MPPRYAPSALMSLASTKRSRVIAALIFTTFVVFFLSRLNEPGTLIFGASRSASAVDQKPFGYDGPRFELFGIRDFAADVEIAVLNIKVKDEVAPDASPVPAAPSHGSPGLSTTPNLPSPVKISQRDGLDGSSSSSSSGSPSKKKTSLASLQRQLPIAMPAFAHHDLSSPDFNVTDLDKPRPGVPPATISLTLPAPEPQPDSSDLVFGFATTLERMPDTLRNIAHWAAGTDARFVVVHEPQNDTLRPGEPSPDDVRVMYREAGIPYLDMVERDAGWGERFVELIGELERRLEPQSTWGVLMDDDTFFFDLGAVRAMLAKYDASQPWYVGALSENKWNVNEGGLFAMGGAGVFMSRALLEELAPAASDGSCLPQEGETAGGDVLVGECVHRHTLTKLTREQGLFQLDLHGDLTGFYEAVRPQPLSVHHWKSWHQHDIPSVAGVARACGRACVLQSFRFQDGWQMANGFSIVRYGYNETALAAQHPLAMEHTWKVTVWDIEDSWKYSLAPLKERDESKVQFLMERTVEEDENTTAVYYVRREDGIGRGLIKVVWHRTPVKAAAAVATTSTSVPAIGSTWDS